MSANIENEQTPGAQITRLYLIVLGRRPDRAGLEAYIGHFRNGQTLEEIATAFTASEEFLTNSGNEAAAVILYRNAYGVMPTPEWLTANHQAPEVLAAALVRDSAVILRLPTPLYLNEDTADPWMLTTQVVRLYLVVLGRRPDPAGLAAYIEHRRTGLPLEDIAEAFIASEEFRVHADNKAVTVVLYRNAHGVAPSPSWVDANTLAPKMVATALVADPAVMRHLSVLEALFPDGLPLDDSVLYRRWLSELARPNVEEREAMRQSRLLPSISWVMCLENSNPEWLDAAIASVRTQCAPNVELLLVSKQRLCPTAICHARDDARIRPIRGLPWDSRARLFSRALAECRGEFVGVLGQHDLLHETAAYEVALATASADIVIGDEDAINAEGLRHSPRFGTFRHLDALLAERHPGAMLMRTSLVRNAGGLGTGSDVMENRDLMSRVVAKLRPGRLQHVPILLQSRRNPITAARPLSASSGETGRATWLRSLVSGHNLDGVPQVLFAVPALPPLTSIIVATRDRASLLQTCLESVLERTDYPALEILVLDNGSREEEALVLLHRLGLDPRVRVLRCDGPFNWSALNNMGVREMRGEVVVLLNNDTEVVAAGWLRALVSHALRPDVGIVGAKLLYLDRSVQHAGMVLGPAGRATHMWRHSDGEAAGYMDQLATVRDVTALTGACVALRREVYERVGGLEETLPVTWSDVDLCLRVRKMGLRAIWTPEAILLHHEQASRGTDETADGQKRLAREKEWMLRRWGEAMEVDAFLSPNMLPSEARALLAPVPRRMPAWREPRPSAEESQH